MIGKRKTLMVIALLAVLLISGMVFAQGAFNPSSKSFSSVKTQSQSPRIYNPYGSQYTSLLAGPSARAGDDSEFFDLQVFIPPFGCSPPVVRSDLLEEQNVPVFCELATLQINPGIDINRIDRISFTQRDPHPFIAGVGFYPARAAIRSRGKLLSSPVEDNIGYVVVVLKRIKTEAEMPDFITTNLSAILEYGAEDAFGIGQSEFYLPVLTNEEFRNNLQEFGFLRGIGYLRVEDLDENRAAISIYLDEDRKLTTTTLEKGRTSQNIFLPTNTGGKGVKIQLKGITEPETKARIIYNGDEYEVFKNGKFGDGRCRLVDLEAQGGGTGTVVVRCGSKRFTLEKNFVQVELNIGDVGSRGYSIGERLDILDNNVYLAYVGKVPISVGSSEKQTYTVTVNHKDKRSLDSSELLKIRKTIAKRLKDVKDEADLKKKVSSLRTLRDIEHNVLLPKEETGTFGPKVEFEETKRINRPFGEENKEVRNFYDRAIGDYDGIINKFDKEPHVRKETETIQTYGGSSLCAQKQLAEELKQNEDARDFSLALKENYPKFKCVGVDISDILSNLGATASSRGDNIFLELVSVTEPTEEEASVKISYRATLGNTRTEGDLKETFEKGEVVEVGDSRETKITLISFGEESARISYSCKKLEKAERTRTITKTVNEKGSLELDECEGRIVVDEINLKEVAHVRLIPSISGRSKATNFTFSIGIDKRDEFLKPTPEEAREKIKSLNESIEDLREINENLAEGVRVGKALCLATEGYIYAKNFFGGLDGTATARRQVMKDTWNPECKRLAETGLYTDAEACLLDPKNIEKINKDVEERRKILKDQNEEIKVLEKEFRKDNDIIGKSVDSRAADQAYFDKFVKTAGFGGRVNDKDYSKIIDQTSVRNGDIGRSEMNGLVANQRILASGASDEAKEGARKKIESLMNIIDKRSEEGSRRRNIAKQMGIDVQDLLVVGDRQTRKEEYPVRFFSDYEKGKTVSVVGSAGDIEFSKSYTKGDIFTVGGKIYEVVKGPVQIFSPSIPQDIDRSVKEGKLKVTQLIGKDERIVTFTTTSGVGALVPHLAVLKAITGGNFVVNKDKVFRVGDTADGKELRRVSGKDLPTLNFIIEPLDETSYRNPCRNCNKAKFHRAGIYEGLPAEIPFDPANGWYVATKNLLPAFGAVKTFQDSGQVNTFWLCNVGKDGLLDGVDSPNDKCRRFDSFTGDVSNDFHGLSKAETKRLVAEARDAIREASEKIQGNPSFISIRGGKPLETVFTSGDSGAKCTDFSSPGDCKLLFNACDPVVCPSSRCDFGGQYPVDDVIQSGIGGSLALCLPNIQEGIVIPICLTGLHAGLEGWISIQEAYRDCLEEGLKNNKTVGICDQVHSIHQCDFLWRQGLPFLKPLTKNILTGGLFNPGTRGGGEYFFAADAIDNADESFRFFTRSYAQGSKLGFAGARSFGEIGSDICKMQFSATYPDEFGDIFDPESPPQIHAWFDERTFTDATVPPTSQYKVFYHIFSGGDQGVAYTVYLKSPTGTLGIATTPTITVDSGFIGAGDTVDETKDFIAPSGFKQLCVRINTKDHCGFKQVSTSFALNYIRDKTLEDQAAAEVKTERACVAGSPHIGSLLTPNLQQGIEEVISPELYNQGIIRVCSTGDPGEGSDEGRWKKVGFCDQSHIGCWVDQRSVEASIKGKGIEAQTIEQLNALNTEQLIAEGKFDNAKGKEEIDKFENRHRVIVDPEAKQIRDTRTLSADRLTKLKTFEQEAEGNLSLIIFNIQKARLLFVKATVYDNLAKALYKPANEGEKPAEAAEGGRPYNKGDKFTFEGKTYVIKSDKVDLPTTITQEIIDRFVAEGAIEEEALVEKVEPEVAVEKIKITVSHEKKLPDEIKPRLSVEYFKLDGFFSDLYFYQVEGTNFLVGLDGPKGTGVVVKEIRQIADTGQLEWVLGSRQGFSPGGKSLDINGVEVNFSTDKKIPSGITLVGPKEADVGVSKVEEIADVTHRIKYGYYIRGTSEFLELTLPSIEQGRLFSIIDSKGENILGGRGFTASSYTFELEAE